MGNAKYGIYQLFFEMLSQRFPALSEQGMMFQFQLPLLSISASRVDEEKLSWITNEFSKECSIYCGNSLSRLSEVYEKGLNQLYLSAQVPKEMMDTWYHLFEPFQDALASKNGWSWINERWKDVIGEWEDTLEYDFEESFESEQWQEDPIKITANGSTQNMSDFFEVEKYKFTIKIENMDLFDVVRGEWFSEKAFMRMLELWKIPYALIPSKILVIDNIQIELEIEQMMKLMMTNDIKEMGKMRFSFLGIPVAVPVLETNALSEESSIQILGVLCRTYET